jgi:putative transposase
MSHSYANNYVHAVFSTKGRISCITPDREKRLYPFLRAVGEKHGIPLISAGGMPDHSHLLFRLPATMSLAAAMNLFKANSSRFLREELPFQWQSGYGAFSVSHSQRETVIRYIHNQHEHHRRMTFEEEFVMLLKKSGASFDPMFVFG